MSVSAKRPLAESLRPETLDDFIGQSHFRERLRTLMQAKELPSLLLFGPPGCGKTHFAARVKDYFPSLTVLSYDTIKERYFDEYGFDNMKEKSRINDMSIAAFYTLLEEEMRAKKNILIE